ncbi:MAG: UvrD-helicase domain-containing protein [Pseudomonadales bacterium]|nr:UvrD-helicase domain-containing protein [Pseudomonadales bacterium]
MNQQPGSQRAPKQQLNPAQRDAVRYVDGPLLVLAGAGSGKTSVITRKIQYLVRECEMPARQVTAVTFTNKAAREMRARARALLGDDAKGLQVSTFHQLGLKILQRELPLAGRKSGFSILDDQDSTAILKDLLLRDGDIASTLLDICRNQISHWKSHAVSPASLQGKADSVQEARIAEVYARYERALASYNAVDFDDLIAIPVRILAEHEEVLKRWQSRIRYLLVDEYQDTNVCQYMLVQQLVGERSGLCVVGDDDQSIYAWRGANPENLKQLAKDFKGLKVIKLEQNYRSTNRILQSANALIANNDHLFEKKLWSEKGQGDAIVVQQLPDEEAETEYIGDEILHRKIGSNLQFRDFAVLVRGNHQTRLLELKLQAKQIPYQVTGGTSFFARNEIKDVMAYLRVLANPDDDAAFLRIVNVPRRKIGVSTLEALGDYSKSRECSLYGAIGEMGLAQTLSEQAHKRLSSLDGWFQNLRRVVDNGEPMRALQEMLDDIDYRGWLVQNSSSTAVGERRYENVNFLLESIRNELQKQNQAAQGNTNSFEIDAESPLEAVLNKLMLRDMLEQQAEEEADNKVQVMTLHASKGLEFPHVFIIGFEEQLLPHRNSIEGDTIDEERRLAYVGITRAQQHLTLTMARTRKQFGDQQRCAPSRFLEELPVEALQRKGFGDKMDAASNEATGRATLDNLRALLE